MRTTFDLPADVTDMLRMESARRGGRAVAPMNQLLAEAVLKVFGPKETPRLRPRITGKPGCITVRPPKGVVTRPVTTEDVNAILEEMI